MIYDETELKRSIDEGERKLAERRQSVRRRKKQGAWILGAFGVLLPLCIAAGVAAGSAPSTPHLVVTWPKGKVAQNVESGQIVLAREGQPFSVAVSDASNWQTTWRASSVENEGDAFDWAPQTSGETLVASCRAQPSDWTALFARLWPARQVSLGAVLAEDNGGFERTLNAPNSGVWVYEGVQATGQVAWDERALPILSQSASVVPGAALDRLGAPNSSPAPALWQLVSDFEASTSGPAADGATYAALFADNLETALPQIGARLVQIAPEASIKWVLRLSKDAPQGIVRLSFDNKRQRQAWVKRDGQSAGTPVTGWENGVWSGSIPLEVPTQTPSATP